VPNSLTTAGEALFIVCAATLTLAAIQQDWAALNALDPLRERADARRVTGLKAVRNHEATHSLGNGKTSESAQEGGSTA
jgi:hypothetical protein